MPERWEIDPSWSQLFQAIDSMNCGIVVRDLEGQVVYANQRLLDWLNYTPEELRGLPGNELVPPEFRAGLAEEYKLVLEGNERARIGAMRRSDGRTFPSLALPTRLYNDQGELTGALIVIVDLGELQAARRLDGRPDDMVSRLDRISLELKSLSLTAGVSEVLSVAIDHPELVELSAREREVLALLLEGSRPPAIAKRLFISPNTVRNHLKAMYRKLGVSSQSELIEHVRGLANAPTET